MPTTRQVQAEGAVLSLSKHQSLTRAAMTQLNLSARAYHRTRSVKLARTIAVWLDGQESSLLKESSLDSI